MYTYTQMLPGCYRASAYAWSLFRGTLRSTINMISIHEPESRTNVAHSIPNAVDNNFPMQLITSFPMVLTTHFPMLLIVVSQCF